MKAFLRMLRQKTGHPACIGKRCTRCGERLALGRFALDWLALARPGIA
jgi:hypothetical protein